MDIYLVYRKGKGIHQFVSDPTNKDMEDAEVLTRRLGVTCHTNLAKIYMLKVAVMDMMDRLSEEDMIPERLAKFAQMANAFGNQLSPEIKAIWEVYERLSISALSNRCLNLPTPT